MRASDTSEKAAAIQAQLQNALSPEERLRLALKFSGFAREFAKAALRERYPHLTEAEISRSLIKQLHGNSAASVR